MQIENDANSMPRLVVKSKNAENSTKSSSSPVESSTLEQPMPVPMMPVAGSDCENVKAPQQVALMLNHLKLFLDNSETTTSQQTRHDGMANEIQNSTGISNSLQRNFNLFESEQNRDRDIKILHEICSEFLVSADELPRIIDKYFDFLPSKSASDASSPSVFLSTKSTNSSLKSKSRSLIDVDDDEDDNEESTEIMVDGVDDGNPSNRETLPSVNVSNDNKNDKQDDDNVDNKNNDGVVGGGGRKYSMQNSSLTSKDLNHSAKIAAKMGRKSSKEFHHNDDEVGWRSIDSSASSSSSTTNSFLRYLYKYSELTNGYDSRMIDDSATAHFTPSSYRSYPSSNIKASEPSPSSSTVCETRQILTVAHRAKFNSFTCIDVGRKWKTNNDPPQMEPLSIVPVQEIDSSTSTYDSNYSIYPTTASVCSRKLPRFPIRCPLTNCDSYSVPSDFCNHITIDHPSIVISNVAPGEVTNMTINHMGNFDGTVTCQRMFLVSDKVK